MGVVNTGNQQIYFRYNMPLISSDLGKLLHNLIKPGIYDGGLLTIDSGDIVNIAVMDVLCNTSANQAVHVKTQDTVQLTIAEATPYITCQFTWVDQATNYMDFTAKAVGDLLSTDIIIGMGVYVANVLTSFDYSEKTWGLIDQSGNVRVENDLLLSGESIYEYLDALHNGNYVDLLVSRPSTSTVTVSWTELFVGGRRTGAQSFTLNIANSGLLGLDTGSESADAWYYIWIIAKADGTVSAILSASATAPTIPTGYIYKRLVSMVRNTSGDFVNFVQENERWGYVSGTAMKTASTFLNETLDCSVYIPEKVQFANIIFSCSSLDSATTSQNIITVYQYLNGTYTLVGHFTSNVASINNQVLNYFTGKIGVSSRSVKYISADVQSATSVLTQLRISSFEVPL
jgi:hypothetical protein